MIKAKMKDTRRTQSYPLQGGEDLITPVSSRKPGTLVGSRNFECDASGRYRRVKGYERFDGNTSPSDESYWILDFDAGSTAVAADATVTGASSSATGIAVIAGVLESGTYAGSDAAGYLVLRSVSGTFEDNENLQVGGATYCVADGTTKERGADTSTLDTTYYRAAVEAARDDIEAVPGSGNVLGVWPYDGTVYAFRANTDGDAVDMYKSSSSGWTKVTLGHVIDFDAGTDEFVIGETVTGSASTETATIANVVLRSGAWGDNDAVGLLVVTSASGTFDDDETITSASGSATVNGDSSDITLATGGRYDFVNYNFGGHSGTYKMYGCDGANYAFEFDGTTYTPIKTGMTTDTPTHITAHKKHLFLSFTGGSVQHSSTGYPYQWTAVTGASELGLGQEITGFSKTSGDTLGVWGRNMISILYGSSTDDWDLKSFSTEVGAYEWSVQKLGEPLFLDDLGISSLSAVQEYGDFKANTLSQFIEPFFTFYRKGTFVTSLRVKEKSQYRLYFGDKTGLNLTIDNGKVQGFTKLKYEHTICCASSGEDSNGSEVLYFGSDDGMVYQLEKGTSFDGTAIKALIKTSLNKLGSPENVKRFFKIVVERDDQYEEGEWGIGHWGNFEWGEQGEETEASYLDETGTGYDYIYYSSSAYLEPFILQGITLHYSIGGLRR
jgi:hypothetical protein